MVVTVTRGGYIKRTRSDNYRSQHRGGKGVKGAQLRARRRRRALLRHDDAPLAAVLHHQGPRLPRQGLRAARGRPRRQGPARRQPARPAAGRGDRRRSSTSATTASATYLVLATRERPGQEDARSPSTTRTGRAASSRSTCAKTTNWSSRAARRRGRRPAPRLPQGHVAPVHRDRRGAAPDGPIDRPVSSGCTSAATTACSTASVVSGRRITSSS